MIGVVVDASLLYDNIASLKDTLEDLDTLKNLNSPKNDLCGTVIRWYLLIQCALYILLEILKFDLIYFP